MYMLVVAAAKRKKKKNKSSAAANDASPADVNTNDVKDAAIASAADISSKCCYYINNLCLYVTNISTFDKAETNSYSYFMTSGILR